MPLVVKGSRQIGKTASIVHFAETNYKSFVNINFAVETKYKTIIEDGYDVDSIVANISRIDTTKKFIPGKTLILFDELQDFPEIASSLKFFCIDKRYDVICSGSLLGINYQRIESNSVGYKTNYEMFSMDFEEFCLALDEAQLLDYTRKCFDSKVPLENNLHKKAMLLFRQYMLVGGMPKAVAQFIQHDRNFSAADIEKRKILETYRNDIAKIDREYRSKVQSIFDQIPSFLSQHEKRIRLRGVEGSVGEAYEDTFFWLADSMIVNECFNTTDPNIGLSLNEERTYIKCYMGDTGLLISHTFDENQLADEDLYLKILQGKLSLNEGMFFENVVAQMLSCNGHKLYYYNHYNKEKKRNDIEIDFLIGTGNKLRRKIIPIEVKSSRNYTITSLERFIEKFSERIDHGVVVHPGNLKIQNGISFIPAYMAMYL